MFKFFKKKKISKIQHSINFIKNINTKKLTIVYSSDISIFKTRSVCENILTYIKLLDNVVSHMKTGEMLYARNMSYEVKEVYIRDFYLNKNTFLDPVETSNVFIKIAIDFLSQYEYLENKIERTFNEDKNLLLTKDIVVNVISVLEDIEKCLIKAS